MVEVMKTMATSFQRPHDALLHSVPPALQQPRLTHASAETPGHSWASLGQSLAESPLLSRSPGAQGSVCALLESVSQSCVSFGGSMVG